MSSIKNFRITLLSDCLKNLENLYQFYEYGYPGHVMVYSATANIRSLHHLETETNFDDTVLVGNIKAESQE